VQVEDEGTPSQILSRSDSPLLSTAAELFAPPTAENCRERNAVAQIDYALRYLSSLLPLGSIFLGYYRRSAPRLSQPARPNE
jgi:hypothetical protein